MSDNRVIKHVAAPGFVTGVATGITVHGPSSDGNMHVTFFHDTAYPIQSELGTVATGKDGLELRQGGAVPEGFEVVRHNIATISLRPEQLDGFGRALAMLTQHRADARAKNEAQKQGAAGIQPNVSA